MNTPTTATLCPDTLTPDQRVCFEAGFQQALAMSRSDAIADNPPTDDRVMRCPVCRGIGMNTLMGNIMFECGGEYAQSEMLKPCAVGERPPPSIVPFTTYQERVGAWCLSTFGPEVTADLQERVWRFMEEALELAQALGATRKNIDELADYVFGREPGIPGQEVGGVMTTLAALCYTACLDLRLEAETEYVRVMQPDVVARIQRKQVSKPHSSALPGNDN